MASTLTLTCVKAAGTVRVVDGGRPGFRHLGIPLGGAADGRAQAAGNELLSREDLAPCLEFTQNGGQWLLSGQGQFVLTGADMNWRLNGRIVETYQVQYLDGDGLLTALASTKGLRSYLSVAGEWDLPLALCSREYGLPDISAVGPGWSVRIKSETEVPFRMSLDVRRHHPPDQASVGVEAGPEWKLLPPAVREWLLECVFTVRPDSNRQGIRLASAGMPEFSLPELLSSPVLPGTVQLTPAGPILLGPDAQTIGGYSRVLLVTNMDDLALAFQVGPGRMISFSMG